jgi:glycosyltransferase involved in cell wall biosynthesis
VSELVTPPSVSAAGPSPRRGVRALTVFHLGGVGGPQRSLTGAMAWLRERGSVAFIFPEDGAAAADYRQLGDVTVADYTALTYARGARALFREARRLRADVRFFRSELERRRPDLVIAVTTVLPALLIAARRERIPAVVYAAEVYGQRWKRSPLLRLWGALLAGITVFLSDAVVSCSIAVARQFPSWTGKPHTIAYPPIGIHYSEGIRARGRARYGLADDDFCMAVVGNLSRGRGQDVAIRALELIRRRLPSARLLTVGAAPRRPADLEFAAGLPQLARSLGVAEAVILAGETDDVADVYAAADVVVNPARFEEPFGRVAAEALVAGKPVVASRVGGIPEVIRDGVDGLLVPSEDPVALADAVCRVAADRSLAERLVASGREAVFHRFGPEQDLAAWTTVLTPALRRR